jgi:hemoglobin
MILIAGGMRPCAKSGMTGITEAALERLVHTFYARVRHDPLIGPVFNDAISDWPEHLEKLHAFWSSVMLTTGRYKGRPMPAHIKHAGRIDGASFARWLGLWHEITEELLDPTSAAAMQDRAARIAESLQLGMAFHKGEDLIGRAA